MRRMTVRKSCHGVCNLEACFFGGDLHGWWKLRALPTKTGGDFRASSTKTGGDFVSLPPKLVEISCLSHQNWSGFRVSPTKTGGDFRASPTKTGGDFVSPPPKLVKISCLPTKTGILTCLTLLIRNPAGVRYGSWPLLPTPSKKRGRPTQPRLS